MMHNLALSIKESSVLFPCSTLGCTLVLTKSQVLLKPKDHRHLGTDIGVSAVPQVTEVRAGAKSNNPERSQGQELGVRIWRVVWRAASRSSCGATGQRL